jgi:hypothetical protein
VLEYWEISPAPKDPLSIHGNYRTNKRRNDNEDPWRVSGGPKSSLVSISHTVFLSSYLFVGVEPGQWAGWLARALCSVLSHRISFLLTCILVLFYMKSVGLLSSVTRLSHGFATVLSPDDRPRRVPNVESAPLLTFEHVPETQDS